MKTLNVNTWERVQLLQCVPPTGRTIEDVRKHLRVADILELTEEEKKLVGWKEIQTTQGLSTSWGIDAKVSPDHEFEIQFEDSDHAHLMKLVEQRNEWPTSRLTVALHEKLLEVK